MGKKYRNATVVFLLVLTLLIVNVAFCQKNRQGEGSMVDEEEILKAYKSGDYNLAMEMAKRYLENDPNNVEILNILANAYFFKGNIPAAEETVQKALKINPNNPLSKKLHDQLFLERESGQGTDLER